MRYKTALLPDLAMSSWQYIHNIGLDELTMGPTETIQRFLGTPFRDKKRGPVCNKKMYLYDQDFQFITTVPDKLYFNIL